MQHTVNYLYHGADLSKGLRSLYLRILLQSCHCKLVQTKSIVKLLTTEIASVILTIRLFKRSGDRVLII